MAAWPAMAVTRSPRRASNGTTWPRGVIASTRPSWPATAKLAWRCAAIGGARSSTGATITAGRTGFSRGRIVALAVSMLVRTRLAGGSGSAMAAIASEPSAPTKATADWSALKARPAIAHGRCH